jgi:hypothetical protein
MTVGDLDEVQYDLEVDGEQARRQLARKVWEARGWATVAIVYQERDASTPGEWKPAKLALLKFRRMHEVWKKESSITIDGRDATALGDLLAGDWRDQLLLA